MPVRMSTACRLCVKMWGLFDGSLRDFHLALQPSTERLDLCRAQILIGHLDLLKYLVGTIPSAR